MAELDDLRSLALANYGHFTTLRVEDGRVRGLSLHLSRLVHDCKTLFGTTLDTDRVRGLIRPAAQGAEPATVRVTVFDPTFDLGRPEAAVDPQILVTRRPAGAPGLPPLRVRSTVYLRDVPAVKSVGLFGALHQRRAARLDGFDDALFTDRDGFISEGVTWNIGFLDADGGVVWPDADQLPGVTMQLLQDTGEHRIAPVSLDQLPTMQAAFATNAAVGVRAVSLIDGTGLSGDHPVIDLLRKQYAAVPGEKI